MGVPLHDGCGAEAEVQEEDYGGGGRGCGRGEEGSVKGVVEEADGEVMAGGGDVGFLVLETRRQADG